MTAITSCMALRTWSSTSRTRPALGSGLHWIRRGCGCCSSTPSLLCLDRFPFPTSRCTDWALVCDCSLKGVFLSLPCPTQQACLKLSIGHSESLPSPNSNLV